jgi:hypothetical protein
MTNIITPSGPREYLSIIGVFGIKQLGVFREDVNSQNIWLLLLTPI